MKRYDTPNRMPAFGIAAAAASSLVFTLAVYLPMQAKPHLGDATVAIGKADSVRKARVPHVEIVGVRSGPTAAAATPTSASKT
jgi:hypothetical protein